MTTESPNLKLTLFNTTTDATQSFQTWQRAMSGSSNSNMIKIDNYSPFPSGSLVAVSGSASGSLATTTGSYLQVYLSMLAMTNNVQGINLGMVKLAEWSGSGIVEFNDISQDYQNLILIGTTSYYGGNATKYTGIEFNGDSNTDHYLALAAYKDYVPGISSNVFLAGSSIPYGCVMLGGVGASGDYKFGMPFFAFIPNYSKSSGFYKSVNSFSIGHWDATAYSAGEYGGTWQSNAAITSIKIFGLYLNSYRYNLGSDTKITLYGFGKII